MGRKRRLSSGFLVILGFLALAAAQEPTLRITVTLVQVDVVVTDSKGHHVPDLRAEDFEIRQDGELQKITHFSYVPEEPGGQVHDLPSGWAGRGPAPLDKIPIGPPAPITPGQVKRTVALVVDDVMLRFENIVRVRDSLRKYVERDMQPGDLVALVRTGGGVAILEQFTTDKRVLLEAVSLLKWRFQGRQGLLPIHPSDVEPVDAGPSEPQILDYGYSLSALGAIGTLEQVVTEMKRLPGRKSVVFISDNLGIGPRISPEMDRLTDMANRSAVSIYTIDPGGLRTNMPTAAEHVRVRNGADMGRILNRRSEEEFRAQEGLSYLADRTSGTFFHNRNDIPVCIQQAAADQLGYYSVGYSPQAGTFDSNAMRAKFHRVSVTVRRPGVKVRWTSGFTGVPDEAPGPRLASQTKPREQQLLEALASPFTATGIKVRLTSFFTETKTTPSVYSMLFFDAKGLTFVQENDGHWRATADIVTSAYRGIKQNIQQRQRQENIRLTEDQYREALKVGFMYVLNDPMKEPGSFLMRAVVRDAFSGHTGSASQLVDVPDTRKGQLALSGIMLKLAPRQVLPPKEQAELAARDGTVEPWLEGGPAVRRYRPGQSIYYNFMVINPKLKGPKKSPNRMPDVVHEVRVFRNGKAFYTGPAFPFTKEGRLDDRRFVGAGLLRLGVKLTPGEYLLEVIVTDKLASKKKSKVAQWIDFEVTELPAS